MEGKVSWSDYEPEPLVKPHLDLQPCSPRQPAKYVLPDRVRKLEGHLGNRRSCVIVDHRLCKMKNRSEDEAQDHGDE